MAAVVLSNTHDRWNDPVVLRLVASPRQRSTPAVYRRRRLVAALVLCLVVAAALLVTGPVLRAGVGALGGSPLSSSSVPGASVRPVAAETFVVQPGDTLWSLARRMQPVGDIRPLVDKLAAQHRGTSLQPGDRIPVP